MATDQGTPRSRVESQLLKEEVRQGEKLGDAPVVGDADGFLRLPLQGLAEGYSCEELGLQVVGDDVDTKALLEELPWRLREGGVKHEDGVPGCPHEVIHLGRVIAAGVEVPPRV